MHEIDELLLRVYVELRINMVGVRVHRACRDEQFFLDARGGAAERQQVEHVYLTLRQAVVGADDSATLQ